MPWCCAGHNRRYCRICTAVGPCAVLTARSGEGMGKCCRSGCPAAHNKRMGTHASRYGFSQVWILSGHSQSHVLRGTHLSRAHLHLCPVHVELIREDVLHGDERMSLGRAALMDSRLSLAAAIRRAHDISRGRTTYAMFLPSCLFAALPLEMSCQPLPESPAPCSCCTRFLVVNYRIHLFEFAAYQPVRAPVNQMPKTSVKK